MSLPLKLMPRMLDGMRERMLEAMMTDRTPWYKKKFISVPKQTWNPKYPKRHQGMQECARRQRQKERTALKGVAIQP